MPNPPQLNPNAGQQQDAQPPPEDLFAYRIAVGAVGVALVAFLIGAAWIASGGKPVPTQYWSTGSGLAGALIGILAPSPTPKYTPPAVTPGPTKTFVLEFVVRPVVDLWKNRSLLILLFVFGVSLGFSIANNSAPLQTVAAAAGGALIGLLAPTPGTQ
jgi:hypothetical protein